MSLLWSIVVAAILAAPQGPPAGVAHPVIDHKIDPAQKDKYIGDVTRAMNFSDEQWLGFVPVKPIAAYCECPNCYGGVEGNWIFKWHPDKPEQMTCRHCGTVFPNEKFPNNRTLEGKNALGETVTFHYHFNEAKKIPHYLDDSLAYYRRYWWLQQCEALGKAYQVTKDEKYARRVVMALTRSAEVYPHYPAVRNHPREFAFFKRQTPPYNWDAGKWGHFHNEVARKLVVSYDMVYDSQSMKDAGPEARAKIEDDLFTPMVAGALASPHHMSNIIGYDAASVALAGRAMHRPRWVHWAYGKMKDVVEKGFFYDGLWSESPSYHYMTIGGLTNAFMTVRGYSDPPGYLDEVDGERFDNLDPEEQLPFWLKCKTAPAVLDRPNGHSPTVHDSWWNERRSEPRNKTVSTIAPGFGHASLGRGSGEHQMQASLHFSGGHGHSHLDNLALSLYAKGGEMLPDLGYTWTQMRRWTASSLGHNLVVIDRQDQQYRNSDGDLLQFFPDTGGVSVVEADGIRAYQNLKDVKQYRRLLAIVPVSDEDAYVVDIFRVRGGKMHDWTVNGDADADMTAAASVALSGNRANLLEDGEKWVEPTFISAKYPVYGLVRDVQCAKADKPFTVDFNYADKPTKGVRMHIAAGGAAEVLLGRSPSVRRMGYGSSGDMRKVYDFWMPKLIVRRQGEDELQSVFAVVHEPHDGERFIDKVYAVKVGPTVQLRVQRNDATDVITVNEDGRVTVKRGDRNWQFNHRQLRGPIIGAPAPDTFTTRAKLPQGEKLRGQWMVITHGGGLTHGYEIDRVEGETIHLTHNHGLRIKGKKTEEIYFPQRTFKGLNRFVIPQSASE